jgi:hypothetical protein
MKTMKINMVNLFWIFGLLLISLNSNSQNIKLTKKEKKEVREAQMVANFNILDSLLSVKNFVLEADYLIDQRGSRIPVVSTLNFVKVEVEKGVLQTGNNFNRGTNGVGGITAEGSIGKYEISKDFKNMSYNIRFTLMTNIGIYNVFMTVNAGNHAVATITGLGRGRLSWEGHLATVGNSRVFKGMNTM